MVHPRLELGRLALPRSVYTQSRFEYVARTLGEIAQRTGELQGYRMTYAPRPLHHFSARFEPLATVPATQGPGV